MPVLKSHRVSTGEDGVVIVRFLRPLLSLTVGKERWLLSPVWPVHLLLSFSHSTSGIRAQLADGIGEPFFQGADRVPGSSRRGVWAGAGAAWGLVRHRARWWSDAAVAASHRVRLRCRQKEEGEDWDTAANWRVYPLGSDVADSFYTKMLFNFLC